MSRVCGRLGRSGETWGLLGPPSAMTPVLAQARVRGLHNGCFLHSVPRRGLNAATDVASGTAKSG